MVFFLILCTQNQRQTWSSATCWRSSDHKKEVLELGIHLQGLPSSISRNKNHGKTPGFCSSMPWHKSNHLWQKEIMFTLSTQGAAARELICYKVTLCSKVVTFFKLNWSFDLFSRLVQTNIQTNKSQKKLVMVERKLEIAWGIGYNQQISRIFM